MKIRIAVNRDIFFLKVLLFFLMVPEKQLTLCVLHKYNLSHSSLTGTIRHFLNTYLLYDGQEVRSGGVVQFLQEQSNLFEYVFTI